MIEFKITAPELEKVAGKWKQRPKILLAAMTDALEASGFLAEAAAKTALTVGPTRAIRTGFLRASTGMHEFLPLQFTAKIYPTAPYAIYVHEGTQHMPARPFMKEAIRTATPDIRQRFKEAVEKATR